MRASLCLLLATLTFACGESGGDATPAAEDCQNRCETKLTSCGQTRAVADTCATGLCAADPSEPELACAEGAACDALLAGTDGCGIGGGDCPALTCDCPPEMSGPFTIDGRCIWTCEEYCGLIAGE